MRILDEWGVELHDPDLTRGYLTHDTIVTSYIAAKPAEPEVWHIEPDGEGLFKRVVDVPAQPAEPEHIKYEDVMRWHKYRAEDLIERDKPDVIELLREALERRIAQRPIPKPGYRVVPRLNLLKWQIDWDTVKIPTQKED